MSKRKLRKIGIKYFVFILIYSLNMSFANESETLGSSRCIKGRSPKKEIDKNILAEGLKFYSVECDKNSPSACYKLGQFYFQAKKELVAEVKNPLLLGRKYLQKSCDLNYSRACFVLGGFLKKEFQVEEKVHKPLIEKSCQLENAYGCSALADYYYSTRLKDNKYEELISKSCTLGQGRNCFELSRLLIEKKAPQEKVVDALRSGCSLKHEKSCQKLDEEMNKDIQ